MKSRVRTIDVSHMQLIHFTWRVCVCVCLCVSDLFVCVNEYVERPTLEAGMCAGTAGVGAGTNKARQRGAREFCSRGIFRDTAPQIGGFFSLPPFVQGCACYYCRVRRGRSGRRRHADGARGRVLRDGSEPATIYVSSYHCICPIPTMYANLLLI